MTTEDRADQAGANHVDPDGRRGALPVCSAPGLRSYVFCELVISREPEGLTDLTLYPLFAEGIAEGRGYLSLGKPTAYSPGYPYFLGAIQWLLVPGRAGGAPGAGGGVGAGVARWSRRFGPGDRFGATGRAQGHADRRSDPRSVAQPGRTQLVDAVRDALHRCVLRDPGGAGQGHGRSTLVVRIVGRGGRRPWPVHADPSAVDSAGAAHDRRRLGARLDGSAKKYASLAVLVAGIVVVVAPWTIRQTQ